MSNITINQLPAANSIDPVNDLLPIYQNSSVSTLSINRNTFLGISSTPVGRTDSQTVQNKTIDNTNVSTLKDSNWTIQNSADTTKQAKWSLSSISTGTTRTFTLPDTSDTLAALAATQTLTNKTLTSPVINSPTITNATLSADTITGFTSSSNGTIYGMSVASGVLNSSALANAVNTAALQNASVTRAKLAPGTTQLGYATGSSGGATVPNAYTTYATITATSTGNAVRCLAVASIQDGTSGAARTGHIRVQVDGVTISGSDMVWYTPASGSYIIVPHMTESTPSAASHTWTFQVEADTAAATFLANLQFSVQEVV